MSDPATGPHVVIVGGGFAGLEAARALRKAPVRVTLLDSRNHHLFQPLLYQVATAGLSPGDIAAPIRRIVRRYRNVRVLLARAEAVSPDARRLILSDGGWLDYDFLVLATGATHSYFGHDEWAAHAPGLKSVEEALEIRRRVLFAFEAAEREPDPARQRALLTFVVVGGGPTGVELAGALAELSRHTLAREYHAFDPRSARVILCEGSDRLLEAYPPELSEKARAQLEGLGVTVWTGTYVSAIDAAGVQLGEERIGARTVLWAAGVQATPIARSLGAELDRAGRVLVEPDLSVPGRPEVFVVGDLAAARQPDGSCAPGVAPAAMQMGRHVGRAIRSTLDGEARPAFEYVDKGSMATVGRARAVADLGWAHLSGFLAWIAWLVIHLFFLIGFRNRVLVLFQWAWAYWTYQRGARLITGRIGQDRPEPPDNSP